MQDHITKLILIFLFFIATAMSCDKQDIHPVDHYLVGREYSINNNLSFTINRISDSRCPDGLICIWGGDVYMDFQINEGNSTIDTTMNLNYHRNKPSIFGGFRFEIQDVIPYPKFGEEIDPDDVRIVMQLLKQ